MIRKFVGAGPASECQSVMQLETSITSGLVIRQTMPLKTILAPFAAELSKCYWLIETQSGPFRDHHLPDKEAAYEKLFFETDACRDSSCTCWRPGTLPRHAEQVVIDEWTYLFAMRCDESSVAQRASWLRRKLGRFDAEFFAKLGEVSDLFLMHVDGWWEIYTAHEEWQREFRIAFPRSLKRSAGEAGRPPGGAA